MSIVKMVLLELDQYATNTFQFQYLDPSTGLPVNLTNYTAKLQVRQNPDYTTVLLELSTENGGITLGGAAGTINVLFDPADTDFTPAESIPWTQAFYDLYLTHTINGSVIRFCHGTITILEGVTR